MNPFTTDHPLASQSSWFDTRAHPVLSFVCSTFVLALISTPLVLVSLYDWYMSDMGAEPNVFPHLGWALLAGSAISFLICFLGTLPVVLLIRIFVRRWRR